MTSTHLYSALMPVLPRVCFRVIPPLSIPPFCWPAEECQASVDISVLNNLMLTIIFHGLTLRIKGYAGSASALLQRT